MLPMTTFLRIFENFKIPSWVPLRWPDITADVMFYDAAAVSLATWFEIYQIHKPMPEASIVVVPPGSTEDGELEVYDVRDCLEEKLRDIEVLAVAGCGSSRVGTIAFGRTVADALNKRVASLICGYGLWDLGEVMSGADIFFPLNWFLQATDHDYHRIIGNTPLPYLGLDVYDFAYACPEAATLHALLLHHPGHFKTIVGHSKGNFAISAALHALKFSLSSVDDARTLEETFGLTSTPNPEDQDARRHLIGAPDKTDVFTFGCFVSLPHMYGKDGKHMYPSHQYVGNADLMLGFFGSGPLKIMNMYFRREVIKTAEIVDESIVAGTPLFNGFFSRLTGHNVVESNPVMPGYYCHMPIGDILRLYAKKKFVEKVGETVPVAAFSQQKVVPYAVGA